MASVPWTKPFSLPDTVHACEGVAGEGIADTGPLRVLRSQDHGASFQLIPYNGQPYFAISYCWPGEDTFRRIGSSNDPSNVHTPNGCISSHHFSQFVAHAVSKYSAGKDCAAWLDYHCINQVDPEETAVQVAILQRIYARADTTLVILEDTELSSDERAELLHFRLNGETMRLVRRIISARWFTRAWCSQELVLSRRAAFFFHDSSDPGNALWMPSDTLWHCMDAARNHDTSIPLFSVPRGSVPDGIVSRTTAWALSICQHLGCSDEYDKIALVCNLVRYIYHFTARPSAFRAEASVVSTLYLNVLKMANVMAIARHDFSLLLANHSIDNPLQGKPAFGWAGYAIRGGDRTSELWHQKDYDVHRDPDIAVNNKALVIRGILAHIVQEHLWELHRDRAILHVTVDGVTRPVPLDYPVHRWWTSTRDFQLLRDLMTALVSVAIAGESFPAEVILHARIALAYLLAEPDYRTQPEPLSELEDLSALLRRILSRGVGQLVHIAGAIGFVRRDLDHVSFSTILLDEGSVLLVSGNATSERAAALRDRLLFQPFVVRPKLFSPPKVMTANSMVLERHPLVNLGYKCVGCVRGLGMISEEHPDADQQLRVM